MKSVGRKWLIYLIAFLHKLTIINTRFTIQRGYAVESKRGGGNYIRIVKVQISDNDQLLKQMDQLIGATLTEKDALTFIQTLYEEEVITKKEGNLMLVAK